MTGIVDFLWIPKPKEGVWFPSMQFPIKVPRPTTFLYFVLHLKKNPSRKHES